MNSMFIAMNSTDGELSVFMRERAANTYRVSAYYVAKIIAEFPNQVIFPLIFSSIAYWMVGLNPNVQNFFIFVLIIFLVSYTAQCMFHLTMLNKIISSWSIFRICFSKSWNCTCYWTHFCYSPHVIQWFLSQSNKHASLFYLDLLDQFIPRKFRRNNDHDFQFGFEALIINEFQNQHFYCTDTELVGGVCPITNGNSVISNLKFNTSVSNIWIDVGFLCAIIVLLKIVTFLAIYFLKKPRAA